MLEKATCIDPRTGAVVFKWEPKRSYDYRPTQARFSVFRGGKAIVMVSSSGAATILPNHLPTAHAV